MEREDIRFVGRQMGLSGKDLDIFVEFIFLRFPGENSYTYIREWAERFKSQPEKYMDDRSKGIYDRLLEIEKEKDLFEKYKSEVLFEINSYAEMFNDIETRIGLVLLLKDFKSYLERLIKNGTMGDIEKWKN